MNFKTWLNVGLLLLSACAEERESRNAKSGLQEFAKEQTSGAVLGAAKGPLEGLVGKVFALSGQYFIQKNSCHTQEFPVDILVPFSDEDAHLLFKIQEKISSIELTLSDDPSALATLPPFTLIEIESVESKEDPRAEQASAKSLSIVFKGKRWLPAGNDRDKAISVFSHRRA